MAEIMEAVQVLATSPLIGRPVRDGKRELVIGRAQRGHVTQTGVLPSADTSDISVSIVEEFRPLPPVKPSGS